MTEFLTTAKTTAAIEDVIRRAEYWVLLISPYLKFDENFRRRIENKNGAVSVTVIYGKTDLQSKEDSWLKGQEWVETRFCKTLHAKCYLNEKEAVLTSMNLHKFSQQNNHEMGIRVFRENDPQLYDEILREARDIERISEVVAAAKKIQVVKETPAYYSVNKKSSRGNKAITRTPNGGYCIRCKKPLKTNPGMPYCDPHFKSWNKWKNEEYPEKHCHLCGKDWETSKAKPVCRPCYKANKEFVDSGLT